MSRLVISTSSSSGLVLSARHNPVTLTPTGAITATDQSAIFGGPGTTAWTVWNYGTLSSRPGDNPFGKGVAAVYLASGLLINGGTTSRAALISSYGNHGAGVEIAGDGAKAKNFGTIIGYYGVELKSGGLVVNGSETNTSASVIGYNGRGYSDGFTKGVSVTGGIGTVINLGTISTKTGHLSSFGVYLSAGTIINGSSADTAALVYAQAGASYPDGHGGYISWHSTGVDIHDAGAMVVNYGHIIGDTGVLLVSGTVLNASSVATIPNVSISGAGNVMNDGYIGHVDSGSGTVKNYGTTGIRIDSNGTVVNYGRLLGTAGSVPASYYRRVPAYQDALSMNSGAVQNFGTIYSRSYYSRHLYIQGGKVGTGWYGHPAVNLSTGVIVNGSATVRSAYVGAYYASGVSLSYGRFTNFGTVMSVAGDYSAVSTDTATINNYGRIEGTTGVSFAGTGTLTNAGVIVGVGGTAVNFATGGADVVLRPGAVFEGAIVAGGSAASNQIDFAGTGGTLGTTSFTNFGHLVVDTGAHWTLAGSQSLGNSATLSLDHAGILIVSGILRDAGRTLSIAGSGTLAIGKTGIFEVGAAAPARHGIFAVGQGATLAADGRLAGSMVDNGVVLSGPGTLTLAGSVTGLGSIGLQSGSLLDVTGGLGVKTLSFLSGGHETLQLGKPVSVTSTLSGFGASVGNTIDLVGIVGTSASFYDRYNGPKGQFGFLTVHEAGAAKLQLYLHGSYHSSNFHLKSDHHGGTDVTFS